jgi:hypothetical protein
MQPFWGGGSFHQRCHHEGASIFIVLNISEKLCGEELVYSRTFQTFRLIWNGYEHPLRVDQRGEK